MLSSVILFLSLQVSEVGSVFVSRNDDLQYERWLVDAKGFLFCVSQLASSVQRKIMP